MGFNPSFINLAAIVLFGAILFGAFAFRISCSFADYYLRGARRCTVYGITASSW
jgi:hypothetical protein